MTGDSSEQALRELRPDDAYSNSPGVRPSGFHPNRSNDLFPLLDDLQAQSMVRAVRPDGTSHYSYGVWPGYIHTNYANCPAHADTNESYQAGSTGARKQADGRSVVRWDELPVPVPSPKNRFACRWTRHQTCSHRTNPPTIQPEELPVARGSR